MISNRWSWDYCFQSIELTKRHCELRIYLTWFFFFVFFLAGDRAGESQWARTCQISDPGLTWPADTTKQRAAENRWETLVRFTRTRISPHSWTGRYTASFTYCKHSPKGQVLDRHLQHWPPLLHETAYIGLGAISSSLPVKIVSSRRHSPEVAVRRSRSGSLSSFIELY